MQDVDLVPAAGSPPRRLPERRRPRRTRREAQVDPAAAGEPDDKAASPNRKEDVPHIDIRV